MAEEKNQEDNWLAFYHKTDELRKDFADRGWETIKTYLVLSSVLVSIFAGLSVLKSIQGTLVYLLWLLPLFLTVVGILFWYNFKRECIHMYEQIATLTLVESKLGLFEKRKERNVFPEEEYYLPENFVRPKETSIKQFKENQMKARFRFYGIFKYLFSVIPIVSWIAWIAILIYYLG